MLLGGADPSLAQSKLDPPELDRYLRWGPLRVRPGFSVKDLGYDDNIFLQETNVVADYRLTAAPRLDGLLLLGRRGFVEFSGDAGYTLYQENTDQNFLDHNLKGRVTVPFRGFGLFYEAGTGRSNLRPVDREDLRPQRDDLRWAGGAIVELGWRTEVELSYRERELRYEDQDANSIISAQLDRNQSRLGAEVAYRVFGRSRFVLRASEEDNRFLNLFDSGNGLVDRNSTQRTWTGGFVMDRGGDLSGGLHLGRTRVDFLTGDLLDVDEFVGEAELTYRLGDLSRIELEGARELRFSVFDDQSFFLNSDVDLRVVRYLNRLIGLEAGFGTGTLEFPSGDGSPGRDDQVERVSLGLRFRGLSNALGQSTEYALRVRQFDRDSNLDQFDRSLTTVTIDAAFGF